MTLLDLLELFDLLELVREIIFTPFPNTYEPIFVNSVKIFGVLREETFYNWMLID